MKSSIRMFFAAIVVIAGVGTAHAWYQDQYGNIIIQPGEAYRTYGSQQVICQGGGGGGGWNPPYNPTVVVYPNVPCLRAIGPTDGRSMAARANQCMRQSQGFQQLQQYQNCRLVDSRLDQALFEYVYSQRTSVLYEDQIRTVQLASSQLTYRCGN